MTRASAADVITPYVGEATVDPGNPKFTRFRTLKNSGRICRRTPSLILTVLKSETSKASCHGPERMFRPPVPQVPFAGITNAAVLNHWRRLCVKPPVGSPTCVAVWPDAPQLHTSPLTVTPKGKPLCNVVMVLICQLPRTWPSTRFDPRKRLPGPTGNS